MPSTENNVGDEIVKFTGQHTDIAFCGITNGISIDDINNIQDDITRENTMLNFNEAVKDGYLNYDEVNGKFSLTSKGKDHINSNSFIEQFVKDQNQSIVDGNDNTVVINLKGNGDDLNVFKYVEKIDLSKVAYSNPSEFQQVLSYFKKCEKYDFVEMNDGIVTPTEKTTKMLQGNQNISIDNIEKLTTKNLDTIINIDNCSKKIGIDTSSTIKATANATKGVSAAADVASAGASAGVTAGVKIVAELSKAGIKAFNKACTLNQNNKVRTSTQR